MTAAGLRQYLENAGIGQRELARMLDYNERSIRHYCAGTRSIPPVVEYAVRWLLQDWPSNVPPQSTIGGSHGKAEA